jgi:hypothetical protein
LWGVSEL